MVVGGREYLYESRAERGFIYICLANSLVKEYLDQPPAVAFQWPDGRRGEHTFDALLTLTNNTRVAVDVKPKSKVLRSKIVEIQRLIEEQVGSSFAEIYLLRTEDHIHPDDVHDAQLQLRARQFACRASDDVVRKLVNSLHGWCRLRDLVAASGRGGSAFNAAIRLIGEGLLEVRDRSRISYECFVRRARA